MESHFLILKEFNRRLEKYKCEIVSPENGWSWSLRSHLVIDNKIAYALVIEDGIVTVFYPNGPRGTCCELSWSLSSPTVFEDVIAFFKELEIKSTRGSNNVACASNR